MQQRVLCGSMTANVMVCRCLEVYNLHMITHITDSDGEPKRALFNFAPFKKLKRDSKKTIMCIKTQREKYLENLVYHFMQPPRIYMGSR